MVTFEQNKMIISVETGENPQEFWAQAHSEMVETLQCESEDTQSKRVHFLEVLRNMVPSPEQLK